MRGGGLAIREERGWEEASATLCYARVAYHCSYRLMNDAHTILEPMPQHAVPRAIREGAGEDAVPHTCTSAQTDTLQPSLRYGDAATPAA